MQGGNTHKECSSGRKKFTSGLGDHRTEPWRWESLSKLLAGLIKVALFSEQPRSCLRQSWDLNFRALQNASHHFIHRTSVINWTKCWVKQEMDPPPPLCSAWMDRLGVDSAVSGGMQQCEFFDRWECWVSAERSAAAAWPRSHSSQDGGGDWQASNKIRRPGWAVCSPLFLQQDPRLLFTFSHMHYSTAQELPEKRALFRDPLALVLFC